MAYCQAIENALVELSIAMEGPVTKALTYEREAVQFDEASMQIFPHADEFRS